MSSYTNINLNNYLNYNFGHYQLNLCGGDHMPLPCNKEEDKELSVLLEPITRQKSSEESWTMSPDKFQKICVALENKTLCETSNTGFDDPGVSRIPVSLNDGKNWVLTVLHSGPSL